MGKAKKLLLVEDDRDFSQSLRLLLQIKGYGVTIACSGEEALDLYEKEDYSCILMDIKLPGLSGIETAKKMHQENPAVRVLLMTGCERGSSEVASAKSIGVDRVLYKPFRINELLQCLHSLS